MLTDRLYTQTCTTCDSLVAHGFLCVGVLAVALLLWLLKRLSPKSLPTQNQ